MPTLEIAAGQPVFTIKVGETPVTRLRVPLVGQEYQAPGIGRAECRRADDEDGRLVIGGRTGCRDPVQVEIIQIAEGEGIHTLRHLDPVINPAAHKTRALERLETTGDEEDRMLVRLEPGHQASIDGIPEHAASHYRRIEIAKVNVDVGLIRARHPHRHGIDPESADAAILDQCIPVQRALVLDELRLGTNGGLDDADLSCNRQTAAQDDLVFRNHRHRGPGDGIQPDDTFTGPARAHFDFRANELAEVLIDEPRELRLGYAQQQDGLRVPQNLHPRDGALGIHADQGHHRLARVGGDVHDIGGQEYVADQFTAVLAVAVAILAATMLLAVIGFLAVAVVPVPVGFDIGRLAHAMGKAVGARYHIRARDVGAKIRISR